MRSMQWQLGILGTISAFAYRHRETKTNLYRGGRSQDLPNTDFQPAYLYIHTRTGTGARARTHTHAQRGNKFDVRSTSLTDTWQQAMSIWVNDSKHSTTPVPLLTSQDTRDHLTTPYQEKRRNTTFKSEFKSSLVARCCHVTPSQ